MDHSPLDVVAWHGNYVPYKYDLRRFNTMGSTSYDHPDPSIFLVLHSPSDTAGTSNIDFVIFPPRWLAMQNTFRPPWFHRNVANEFMGLICGVYDAKSAGFVPGGSSLAQLHERTWSRRSNIREGHGGGHLGSRAYRGYHGVHVRNPPRDQADRSALQGLPPLQARLYEPLVGARRNISTRRKSVTTAERLDSNTRSCGSQLAGVRESPRLRISASRIFPSACSGAPAPPEVISRRRGDWGSDRRSGRARKIATARIVMPRMPSAPARSHA